VYHCLGGSLSAVAGITPENLNLQSLFSRLSQGNFEEIIFANNLSVEGATTTFYILEEINQLKLAGVLKSDIKITELANGIPVGGSLEFMDEGTIKASFNSRKNID
jgi:recombination protein RecR